MTTNDENQPISIPDVQADDALIDAANAGDTDAMRALLALFKAVNDSRD